MTHSSPAIFLDRDGTLIAENHYLHHSEEVEIFPEVPGALLRLMAAGYRLVVITNQSGVGRGYFTMADVDRVHAQMIKELRIQGVVLDAIYSAPEAPDQPSRGRKPSPQFFWDARDSLGLDLAHSYMIGDKRADLEAGWNARLAGSLLVRTGYGTALEKTEADGLSPAIVVDNLAEAADWILSRKLNLITLKKPNLKIKK